MARLNAGRPLRDLGARDTSPLLREDNKEGDLIGNPYRSESGARGCTVNAAREIRPTEIRPATRPRSAAREYPTARDNVISQCWKREEGRDKREKRGK